MDIQTKEKQMFIDENIRAIRQLLEKQFNAYSKNKAEEKECENNATTKLKEKIDAGINNNKNIEERVEVTLKPRESIRYIKVYVEGEIFLDLPAIKTKNKFSFKQYSRVYIREVKTRNGEVYIRGVIRKKFIYTAMIGRLGVPKYGLIKDIPFQCKVNNYDIKKSDIYEVIPNIEIDTQYCKLCCFSKNYYGDEIANCCIEKDILRIGIIKLN